MSMDFQATVEVATVAVSPTLQSVAVLAIIVLIRTFLSWSLELEITGKWPWQKRNSSPLRRPSPRSNKSLEESSPIRGRGGPAEPSLANSRNP